MRLFRVIAITLAVAPCPVVGGQGADLGLAARIAERIAAVPGADVAVSYRDLASHDSLDAARRLIADVSRLVWAHASSSGQAVGGELR